MENKRIGWIDSVRFLAIFWVMTTHYISVYHGEWIRYWSEGWTKYVLQGLTGKFAVAIFCLLMGYFAALKMSKNYGAISYIKDRYLQFSQGVLFMNVGLALTIRALYHFDIVNLAFQPDKHNIRGVLSDSFLFSSEIILPFWCIQVFFVSSVMLAIVHKLKYSFGIQCVLMLLFILTGYIWPGLCILGSIMHTIIAKLNQNIKWKDILRNKWLQACLLLISFVMIQRPESNATFVLYGISGFIILTVLFQNETIQKMLDKKWLRFLGSVSFEFYLVHIPVQTVVSFYIYLFFMNRINIDLAFVISYILTLGIDILLAYTYKHFLKWWIGEINRMINFRKRER